MTRNALLLVLALVVVMVELLLAYRKAGSHVDF